MGHGVWKPHPATSVSTEWLPWEVTEDQGLGKEWVDMARTESPSSTVLWMKRERTRGNQEQNVKGEHDSSGGRDVSMSTC